MDHYMNPKYGELMGHGEGAREQDEGPAAKKEEHKRSKQQHLPGHLPHIHIHPHHDESGAHVGTTVHVMHHDGTHEKFDHDPDDHEGVMSHYHEHYGSGEETGEVGASPGMGQAAY